MKKDYTKYSFVVAALVIIILAGVSFIPPFELGGVRFKRANIFSDIYKFDDSAYAQQETVNEEDSVFIDEMNRIAEELARQDSIPPIAADTTATVQADSAAIPSTIENSWDIEGGASENTGNLAAVSFAAEDGIVPVENYYPDGAGGVSISDFCALLGSASNSRVVRIAFLGDSYIEGDIITADVRDQLQDAYGGGGVGFVPFSTPLAQNRPTIKHAYNGWTNYNLLKKSSAPTHIRERFFVSGVVSVPANGARATYTATNFRPHLADANTARILFTNLGKTELTLNINDSIDKVFALDSSDVVQQIRVSGVRINKLKVTVNNPQNFYGYGVVMEGSRGVSVDNYSIRGNSGLALFGASVQTNTQVNRQLGYDLVVLQYGLNVMQAGVNKYTKYGEQLRKMINYTRACFPGSAILVLGVGDRSTKQDGVYVSMPAVRGMIAEQRAAAQECGVAFWDTCEAMGGPGSMSTYVRKGWAAKDYTHLSFQGGKQIATEFVKALVSFRETAISTAVSDTEIGDSLVQASVLRDTLVIGGTTDSLRTAPITDTLPLTDTASVVGIDTARLPIVDTASISVADTTHNRIEIDSTANIQDTIQ